MASDRSFVEYVADQVDERCVITYRQMFGEYGLYSKGKIVALICDNQLFVKPTEAGRSFIGDVVEAPPYPGAKNSFLIQDKIEDAEWLSRLIEVTEEELPKPKPKKKRRRNRSFQHQDTAVKKMSAYVNTRIVVAACCAIAFGISEANDNSWSLVTIEDTDTFDSAISLLQKSADSILDEYGKIDVHPVFEFRCAPGSDPAVAFRIDWRRFISSFNTEVGFRVDGGKALWLKLGVDRSNKVTLSKSAADVGMLISRLSDGDIVEVEVAPYSEPPVFVRFDLSSFAEGLGELKESCL